LTFWDLGSFCKKRFIFSYVIFRSRKSFINRGLRRLNGFFNHEAHEGHEEKIDRITGLTEIIEVFGWLCVLGKLCSKSELLTQRLAFAHKAIEMAFFRSQLKTVPFSRKDAQNVQKSAKNDQKGVLLSIYIPKCSKRWLFSQKMGFLLFKWFPA
jgi:hypothetical protein